jgi:small-conductance mechanosensitive channel/CRP-like cAMP-binding protein
MLVGAALFVVTLALRGASSNRHIRSRLMASAVAIAAYLAIASGLASGALAANLQAQLSTLQPLFLAFGVINAGVALLVNSWRVDRLPDRFPTIVQDAMVIGLFALAATLLLQEKIFVATAAGAVVLGLALQDTLGNLFAGLAIQIEKPFRIGHWVRIADIDGIVSQVTWRATKVRTKAGNFVIVPNSKLAGDIIVNYSEPSPETRIEVEVGVTYDAFPNEVKAVIVAAIKDEPLVWSGREPEVLLVDFGASALIYRIRVWTIDFASDEHLRDRIRSAVYYALRRRNIEIPYPMQVQYERVEPPASRRLDSAGQTTLRGVSIFAALSEAEHAELAHAATSSVYAADEVVVRQGGAGTSMFVMASGEAVVVLEPAGQEVARVTPGGFFGEMSLLTGAPRNATVRTCSDSVLLEITADAFRRFVLANPAAVEQVGAAVARRRTETEQRRAAGVPAAPVEEPQTLVDRMRRFLGLTRQGI